MFSFGNQNNEKKKRKIYQPYFSWFQFDEHLNRNSSLGIIITTAGGVDQVWQIFDNKILALSIKEK